MFLKRHLPNALTCCNLLCGVFAVGSAFYFSFDFALLFIAAGAVFDFFDGFVARLLGVSHPLGKELDSLADVVTFGVAPGTIAAQLLWLLLNETPSFPGSGALFYAGHLVAAFSALRLAKFNLDSRQTHSFIGLPTPANALFWAALADVLSGQLPLLSARSWLLLPLVVGLLALTLFSCWLLVSEIPMFALKFKTFRFRDNAVRYLFLLGSVVLIGGVHLLGGRWGGLSLAIVCYVLISLFQPAPKPDKQP